MHVEILKTMEIKLNGISHSINRSLTPQQVANFSIVCSVSQWNTKCAQWVGSCENNGTIALWLQIRTATIHGQINSYEADNSITQLNQQYIQAAIAISSWLWSLATWLLKRNSVYRIKRVNVWGLKNSKPD